MTIDQFKGLVSDLARPFSIIATSGAGAWAIVDVGTRVDAGNADTYVGAVLIGLAGLYFGKSWELSQASKHTAEVEKVRAQANPPPAEALKPAAAEEGELPPDQRVKL